MSYLQLLKSCTLHSQLWNQKEQNSCSHEIAMSTQRVLFGRLRLVLETPWPDIPNPRVSSFGVDSILLA